MLDTQKGQDGHFRSSHPGFEEEYGHHAARGGDHCSLALQHAVKAYKLQQKHGTDSLRIFSDPKDEELLGGLGPARLKRTLSYISLKFKHAIACLS